MRFLRRLRERRCWQHLRLCQRLPHCRQPVGRRPRALIGLAVGSGIDTQTVRVKKFRALEQFWPAGILRGSSTPRELGIVRAQQIFAIGRLNRIRALSLSATRHDIKKATSASRGRLDATASLPITTNDAMSVAVRPGASGWKGKRPSWLPATAVAGASGQLATCPEACGPETDAFVTC